MFPSLILNRNIKFKVLPFSFSSKLNPLPSFLSLSLSLPRGSFFHLGRDPKDRSRRRRYRRRIYPPSFAINQPPVYPQIRLNHSVSIARSGHWQAGYADRGEARGEAARDSENPDGWMDRWIDRSIDGSINHVDGNACTLTLPSSSPRSRWPTCTWV